MQSAVNATASETSIIGSSGPRNRRAQSPSSSSSITRA